MSPLDANKASLRENAAGGLLSATTNLITKGLVELPGKVISTTTSVVATSAKGIVELPLNAVSQTTNVVTSLLQKQNPALKSKGWARARAGARALAFASRAAHAAERDASLAIAADVAKVRAQLALRKAERQWRLSPLDATAAVVSTARKQYQDASAKARELSAASARSMRAAAGMSAKALATMSMSALLTNKALALDVFGLYLRKVDKG